MLRLPIKTAISVFASAAIGSIMEPVFRTLLTQIGYYNNPLGWLVSALNWLENIVGVTAYPWVCGGMIGAGIGAWIMDFANKFDAKYPTKSERFALMANEIENEIRLFWQGQKVDFEYKLDMLNYHTGIRLNALYEKLAKLGIRTPKISSADPPHVQNNKHLTFLQAIAPYAWNGSIAGANKEVAAQMRQLLAKR